MDRLYEHVKSILRERHAALALVTRELIQKETLERDELEKLLASARRRNQRCSGNLACKMPMQS